MSTIEQPATADITQDPAVRAFPPGWNGKPDRAISYKWTVRDLPNGERITVVLACGHSDRRYYFASLRNEVVSPNGTGGFMVHKLHSLVTERCARYSKPRFEAFAAAALAELRELAANGDALIASYLRGDHAPDQ